MVLLERKFFISFNKLWLYKKQITIHDSFWKYSKAISANDEVPAIISFVFTYDFKLFVKTSSLLLARGS